MNIIYAPLFSGSSGNAVFVSGGGANILVDAGVSGTRIVRELAKIGSDIDCINAILVTHEHDDHVKGIGILSRKYHIPVYATPGTWQGMAGKIGEIDPDNIRTVTGLTDFYIRDLNILGFPTPHDAAEPVGYTFSGGGASFTVATDIGCVRESWLSRIEGSQAVLLESNYDRDMLMTGSYPYALKRRIDSARGHLSNDDSSRAAAEIVRRGAKQIILGHLSKQNNFPELALASCRSQLLAAGIVPGQDVDLRIASRDGATGVFSVSSDFV